MQETQTIHSEEHAVLQSIKQVSRRHKYQIYLFLFIAINFHVTFISQFSLPILFQNPMFKCEGSEQLLSEQQACAIIKRCTLEHQYTVTSKLSLYCTHQKINQRNLIQSTSGMGAIFGLLMINWLADRKGKRFCIIFSILLLHLFSLLQFLGIILESVQLIIISQFLLGYGSITCMSLAYLLTSKYISPQLSQYIVIAYSLFGSAAGQISLAVLNSYFPNWQIFAILFVVFFTFSLIVAPFIVKEDPIFLFNNNQMDKLMNLVQQVGAFNRAEQSQILQAQNSLIHKYRFKRTPQICTIIPRNIISFRLVLLIVIMASCSFTTNLVYYGVNFGFQSLQFTVTQGLLIGGFAEIINYVLTIIFMPYFPSIPKILYFASILSATSFFSLSLDIVNHTFLLRVSILFIARFFLTTYASFYATYYIMHLPKNIEGTAAGLIESIGCVGRMIAPLLMTFSQTIHLNEMYIFAICMVLSIFPLLFLYKTKEVDQSQRESTSLNKQ